MDEQEKDTTAPPEPTHEATNPPDNPERDDEAVEKGKEKLEEAGGAH